MTERYYGPDGAPIACKDGYDEIRREYNDKKQAVRFAYFLGGEPYTRSTGFAVMKRGYDENGLVASESYYDADEKPVVCSAGYHRIRRVWKDKDTVESEVKSDTEGKEIVEVSEDKQGE